MANMKTRRNRNKNNAVMGGKRRKTHRRRHSRRHSRKARN
jgi:hypothetical protein